MNTRITNTFRHCADHNRAAFIPYVMCGDPSPTDTDTILDALVAGGADMIELGIPFSDPMADGPVIQAAADRALAHHVTLKDTLACTKRFRVRHPDIPVILMGYYNPIYHMGTEAFAKAVADAEIDGLICVDLPPEESAELTNALDSTGCDFIRLLSPPSLETRLPILTNGAQGYLYYISIAGITGANGVDALDIKRQVVRIKEYTDLPIAVGFGIKTPEDVANLAPHADAIVVGSALIKFIEAHNGDEDFIPRLTAEIQALATATKH